MESFNFSFSEWRFHILRNCCSQMLNKCYVFHDTKDKNIVNLFHVSIFFPVCFVVLFLFQRFGACASADRNKTNFWILDQLFWCRQRWEWCISEVVCGRDVLSWVVYHTSAMEEHLGSSSGPMSKFHFLFSCLFFFLLVWWFCGHMMQQRVQLHKSLLDVKAGV